MQILPDFAMPCSEHGVRVLLPWVRPFNLLRGYRLPPTRKGRLGTRPKRLKVSCKILYVRGRQTGIGGHSAGQSLQRSCHGRLIRCSTPEIWPHAPAATATVAAVAVLLEIDSPPFSSRA